MTQPKRSSSVTGVPDQDKQSQNPAGLSARKRVVLTRPAERQQHLAQKLEQAGFEVLQLPALVISPVLPDEANGANAQRGGQAQAEAGEQIGWQPQWQPKQFDVLVFVSRAAWQCYWKYYLQGSGHGAAEQWDPRNSAHLPVLACVGLSTAKEISRDLQLPLEHIVYPTGDLSSDSEGLWAVLVPKLEDVSAVAKERARVLIVRGQTGRDWLAETLRDNGLSVTCLSVYRRQPAEWADNEIKTLDRWAQTQAQGEQNGQDPTPCSTGTWLITSAESLAAIAAEYESHGLTGKAGFQPQAVVVVHDRLVPLVRAWLGHWSASASAVPVVVTTPEDEAIFKAFESV